jgi:hypothetical protein
MNAICTWWMLTLPEGRGGGALWASAPAERILHETIRPRVKLAAVSDQIG